MADLNLTAKDYNYLLAMLNHEAGNTIANSLKKGDTNDAFGQIAGLAETWLNRAAIKGSSMEGVMYHPQLSHFPTKASPDYGLIQGKANSLDPQIKEMFDGYLFNRAQGEDGLLGKVNQYLNKDLTDVKYSQKYRDWYDKSNLVGAYGDKRNGGESSLQQEFLFNPEMAIPDYKLTVGSDVSLSPSESAADQFAAFKNAYQPPPRAIANPPLPPERPGEFRPDGFAGPINQFSDAITGGLEGVGNAVLGAGRSAYDSISGLFTGREPAPQPAPGPYDFAPGGTPGAIGSPNFGSGITLNAPAPSDTAFSGRFDPSAYLAANADVRASGMNAFEHFLDFGIKEGRTINAAGDTFNAASYAQQNQDVVAAGMDPLTHFQRYGAFEGRMAPIVGPDGTVKGVTNLGLTPTQGPSGTARYVAPDGTAFSYGPDGLTPLTAADFAKTIGNGQTASTLPPGFNEQAYYDQNPDVAAARMPAIEHYLRYGIKEGRTIGPNIAPTIAPDFAGTDLGGPTTNGLPPGYDFNAADYLNANPDVKAAGVDALTHFQRYGFNEGRALDTQGHRLSQGFDGTAYLAANPDVAKAGMDPLQHFLDYGSSEGRQTTIGSTPYSWGSFNVAQGAGPTGNGSFGAGVTQVPSAIAAAGPGISPLGFSGTNVSRGVGNGVFNPALTQTPGVSASGFGTGGVDFSSANVSGGLGAQPQGLGGAYAVGSATNLGMGGVANPFGFGGDVSGFDVNGLGASAPAPTAARGSNPVSQNNVFAIEANNARNLAASQEAAALNAASIGPGGSNYSYNPTIFNPGGNVQSNVPLITAPAIRAPAAPAFALNLSPGAMPGGGGFGGFRR